MHKSLTQHTPQAVRACDRVDKGSNPFWRLFTTRIQVHQSKKPKNNLFNLKTQAFRQVMEKILW